MGETYRIEDLIPHRQRLRLIDTITSVDQDHAETRATVRPDWPLMTPGGANPIVLIELAAQTAGVCLGWSQTLKPDEQRGQTGGWLVGIKRAHFSVHTIPVETCITIRSENRMAIDQYREISATASISETPIAEIQLQVLQAGKTAFSDLNE